MKPRRRGLAARLTWAFALLTSALLLVVGLVLIFVSYNTQLEQIVIRQQKTADEAALVTSAYLTQAQDILQVYARVSGLQSLLLRSLASQQEQLGSFMNSYTEIFQDLALLDDEGHELARVSRFRTFLPEQFGSQADTAAFQQAIQGQTYVAPEMSVSSGSTSPEVVMAAPLELLDMGVQGVLVAGVGVQGMWDAVAQVQVGESGYAYIVDLDSGQLIAHSNPARFLALAGTSLAQVPIVERLMAGAAEIQSLGSNLGRYEGLEGEPVIGAAAPLAGGSWAMIVELPTAEALADVRQMLYLLAFLVMLGALVSASLGLLIPRRIIQPLAVLQEGASQIGAGHLDHVIDLQTGDELQDLAQAFNQMAANLTVSQAELERWGHQLEHRVEERTGELARESERARRRAGQLQTSADVARTIASERDLDRLLPRVAELISERFGWYHVGIFLLDREAEYAVLRAANSLGGQEMLQRGHRLKVGQEGIVGSVTRTGRPRIALDVGEDAVYFDTPELHGTRSEMAVPLQVGKLAGDSGPGGIIGAIDVQSTAPSAYDEEDVALLSNLADQVAVAIENARLFAENQAALDQAEAFYRQYVEREWTAVTARHQDLAYEYDAGRGYDAAGRGHAAGRARGPRPYQSPEIGLALARGELIALPDLAAAAGKAGATEAGPADLPTDIRAALIAPIKLRDQVIGVLDLQETDRSRHWTDDEISLVSAISDQVGQALENARLLEAEQGQRKAAEALREAAVVLSSTLAFDQLIQRILDQIGQVIPCDARNLMLVEDSQVHVVSSLGYERFGAQELMADLWLSMDDMPAIQQMARSRRPIVIPDTATYPNWVVEPELSWLRSYVGAPIVARGQLVGILNVDSATPGFFSQEHADQLEAFAAQAAIALENTQLVEETSRRAEQLAALNRIGLAITAALDLNEVLTALHDRVRQIVAVDSFYVALYEQAIDRLEFPLAVGLGSESGLGSDSGLGSEGDDGGTAPLQPATLAAAATLARTVIRSNKPLYLPDSQDLPPARSYLGVPLVFRDVVFGVFSIQSRRANAYTQGDVELLGTIATQASIAIQNARAYERLVETADELREVDRLKTQFLANMSHELRTPLNSIIGFSRVMLKGIDGPLNEFQEADLTSIYSSGQHLLGLINSILDMSKIEAGKMDLSFDEVHLHDIFASVVATARGLLKDRPIELKTELPEDLPSVWADAQRIRQVLINLMSNAAKFTEEGHITLRAVAEAEQVTISVSDTGIGIDPDAQNRLFIPFQQVDASTSRRAGGTGLGLAISHRFLEMHGGEIWVQSEVGAGSTFGFSLPIYQVVRQREHEQSMADLDPGRKAILSIDDDEGVITLLRRYVEHDGYQVIGVRESHQALETAKRLAADLTAITLDIVMPNMDGWQVLRALKKDPQTKDIPVILCSIVDGLEDGLNLGAAICLHKPVTRDEILEALRKVERNQHPS